ncbi:unnamed protein product, partial [Rotaria sp. Silwood1]
MRLLFNSPLWIISIKLKKKIDLSEQKNSISSSSTSGGRVVSSRRPVSSGTKTPLVTSNTSNTPVSSNEQSPSIQTINPKRPTTA